MHRYSAPKATRLSAVGGNAQPTYTVPFDALVGVLREEFEASRHHVLRVSPALHQNFARKGDPIKIHESKYITESSR